MKSAIRAKERILAAKWRDVPRAMLIKKAVLESGENGRILHTEIARLTDELTAKEAANKVLIGDLRVSESERGNQSVLKNRYKKRMEYYKKQLDNLESGIE